VEENEKESEELYVCVECGYEGPEDDFCPDCGGQMLPKEKAEGDTFDQTEEGEEDLEEEAF